MNPTASAAPGMRFLVVRLAVFRILLACVSLVWMIALPAHALTATAGAVLQTPERYDRQSVTLAGTVTNLDQRVSQRGNAYYTFDLQDATGRIRVFSFGDVQCPEGRQAIVDRIFETVKHVGR